MSLSSEVSVMVSVEYGFNLLEDRVNCYLGLLKQFIIHFLLLLSQYLHHRTHQCFLLMNFSEDQFMMYRYRGPMHQFYQGRSLVELPTIFQI